MITSTDELPLFDFLKQNAVKSSIPLSFGEEFLCFQSEEFNIFLPLNRIIQGRSHAYVYYA
jgi:hypothetical protein